MSPEYFIGMAFSRTDWLHIHPSDLHISLTCSCHSLDLISLFFCIVFVREMANSLSLHTHFYTIAFHTIWLFCFLIFPLDFPVKWIKKDGGCRSSCTTILLLCLIKPQYHPQLNCASKITEHTVKIGPFFVPLLKVLITYSNCVWNTKWMLHILHILPQ